jgi:hypothetical protein
MRKTVATTSAAMSLRDKLLENGVDQHRYPVASSLAAALSGDTKTAVEILQATESTSWDFFVRLMWVAQINALAANALAPGQRVMRQAFHAQVNAILAALEPPTDQPVPWWLRMYVSTGLWEYEQVAPEYKGRVRNQKVDQRIRSVRRRFVGLPQVVTEQVLRAQEGAISASVRHTREGTAQPDGWARLWIY